MNRSFVPSPPGVISWTCECCRWTAAGLATAISGAAALTTWRRAAGALSQPLDVVPLLAAGTFWCCAAAISRRGLRCGRSDSPVPTNFRWISGALTVATVAFGASLSVAGTGAAGLTALWGLLIAGESVAWPAVFRRGGRGARRPRIEGNAGDAVVARGRVSASTAVDAALWRPTEPSAIAVGGEELVQQLIRTRHPDGRQTLRGVVRVAFAAGQRSSSTHVAFCPPFGHAPHLDVDAIGGPEVRIKTAQLLPFGARLDLKLAEPAAEPVVVALRISVAGDGHARG